uniref:CSON008121 protein n=1 Tax=Culicoides sonorensis TaxID=179676 RepID=A0A336M3R0_CULSO
MEEAAALAASEPANPVYDTLVELFGIQSKDKINKVLGVLTEGEQNSIESSVQLETAIEMMFEILNQEADQPDDGNVDKTPQMPPPQKPSRSNISTGAKKKTTVPSFSGAVQKSKSMAVSNDPTPGFFDGCMEQRSAKFLPEEYKKAVDMMEKGYKVMILMRGLPGSGKSFLAKQLLEQFNFDPRNHIFSADSFFINVNGEYVYDQNKLTEAHEFCQSNALRKIREFWSPIIIDNTNIKLWNMYPYIRLAVQYRYKLIIMEPATPWATTPKTLTMKNQHNVPKERIRQMMDNYERTSVTKLLNQLNLNEIYVATPPEYRHYPPFTRKFIEQHKNDFPELLPQKNEDTNLIELSPKPRRSIFNVPEEPQTSSEQNPPESLSIQADTIDWQSYEQDNFWNKIEQPSMELEPSKMANKLEVNVPTVPKPKRDNVQFSLLDSLQEAAREEREKFKNEQLEKETIEKQAVPELIREQEDLQKELIKHKKDCVNENKLFKEMRKMFPTVGIAYLWDLFVKCNGDPDWAIDVLINDPKVNSFEDHNPENDDFECEKCDTVPPKPVQVSLQQSVTLQKPASPVITEAVKEKRAKKTTTDTELKRMIEESFVIGDEHYSAHTRKIRNFRHGPINNPSTSEVMEIDEELICEDVEQQQDIQDTEVVEIDLGLKFVQQLEELFGTNVFKIEDDSLILGDLKLKTNIFLTKGLGQQLYALWCESVHNQLEEHRLKVTRDDLELARQLDAREKYPAMFREEQPKTFQDIVEIEKALSEYKQDISKWKETLPDTIAYNLAKDKLFALFPNIDREVAVEILAAHKNNLDETINVLKNTLKHVVDDTDLEKRSKELFKQAQQQINELSEGSTEYETNDLKLSPEETKRAALKEFEECSNIAMHHSQLKAECLAKARNAIQRNEHGVAFYYSQIAELHKSKIDYYNNRAANCLYEAQNMSRNNENMLDLHYLYSSEAIECLDLFLDEHIRKLINAKKSYKHVYVITGRGKNSVNGIPAIKIRVKGRLRERELKFSEVNPGLLKVKVFHNSNFS